MTTITVRQYEEAERRMAHEGALTGVIVHGTISALVGVALVLINVFVAPEFPWSPFPLAGMAIGFFMHWFFGYHRLDTELARKQHEVETRAAVLS